MKAKSYKIIEVKGTLALLDFLIAVGEKFTLD